VLLTALALLGLVQPAPPPLTAADLEAWLERYVPGALRQYDLAGVVVVVVKDGRVLLQKGFGHADLARGRPMDPDRTGLPVASVSKTFTWTAVMQLVEQGRLDLDRDVNEYLDFRIPPAFDTPITLRHLMTHTGGFEEQIRSRVVAGQPPLSLAGYLTAAPPPARIYPAGTVQAYSNYGTNVAGYVVERVSGESFPDYIQRHILNPLGMTRSSFLVPLPEALRADLAIGYDLASTAVPLPPEANIAEIRGDPAGGLVTTGADLARFMVAHLDHGRIPGGQLLASETADRMHAATFAPFPGAQTTSLGFFGGDYNGRRIVLHDGDATGFHSDMQLLLDDGVGFFSSVNSDGTGGLLGAAYQFRVAFFRRFMDRYFPAPPEAPEPTVPTAAAHARLVAGEYEMSRRPTGDFMQAIYLAARIRVKATADGTIETPGWFDFERGRPQRWREVGPFVWREVGGRGRLIMKVESGRVAGWLTSDLSGFLIEPVSVVRSAALNLPLLALSAAVLLGTVLWWPVQVLRRRRSGRPTGQALAIRLAAAAGLAFLAGWGALLLAVGSGQVAFDPRLDPWIRVIQLIGVAAVIGAALAGRSTWQTWRERKSVGERIGSLMVTLALLDLVWFSFAFNLLSVGLNY
jgi:CubicO group peptidase (beta-lactamase class C family)